MFCWNSCWKIPTRSVEENDNDSGKLYFYTGYDAYPGGKPREGDGENF